MAIVVMAGSVQNGLKSFSSHYFRPRLPKPILRLFKQALMYGTHASLTHAMCHQVQHALICCRKQAALQDLFVLPGWPCLVDLNASKTLQTHRHSVLP